MRKTENDFAKAARAVREGDGAYRGEFEIELDISRALLAAYEEGFRDGELERERSAHFAIESLLGHVEEKVRSIRLISQNKLRDLE